MVLRLFRTEVAFEPSDDLGRVFRHRYVLLHYLGLSIPILLAFLFMSPVAALHVPHLPSITLGIVAMMVTMSVYVRLVRKLLQRWTGSKVVLLSPGFLLAAPVLMLTVHYVGIEMGVQGRWSPLRAQMMVAGLVIYLEVAGTIVLRGPVRRALANLRAEQKAARAALAPSVSLVKVDMPPVEPETSPAIDEGPAELQDLLRLQAQGNYVLVVTAGGRHLVPGPFSARIAKLPERQGRRVHRSHWVAAQAVVEIRSSGRNWVIKTVDGASIPVATGQIAEIRDWAATAVPAKTRKAPGNGRNPAAAAAVRSRQ